MQKGDQPQPDSQSSKKYISKDKTKSTVINMKSVTNLAQKKKEELSSMEIPSAPSPEVPNPKLWYEAITEEGYKYYWNSETSGKYVRFLYIFLISNNFIHYCCNLHFQFCNLLFLKCKNFY